MGNKQVKRQRQGPRPVIEDNLQPPQMNIDKVKVSPIPKLMKVKDKCKTLGSKKGLSTATKMSIIKEAIPGIQELANSYYSID